MPGFARAFTALPADLRTIVSNAINDSGLKQREDIKAFNATVQADLHSKGMNFTKPAPDSFLKAAANLGVSPERTVVVEDAISGVQSARAGKFGLVIGVDREGHADALLQNGADVIVKDLGELVSSSH